MTYTNSHIHFTFHEEYLDVGSTNTFSRQKMGYCVPKLLEESMIQCYLLCRKCFTQRHTTTIIARFLLLCTVIYLPCSNGLSSHKFRPRFALFPVVGTGRIDVVRGLVSASVVSSFMAVNSSRIKGLDGAIASVHSSAAEIFAKPHAIGNGASVRIPPTLVHKYEPLATRDLVKPHAVGASL
ncbi:hypothetical protein AVEN_95988-1 [Araneus ventricosus]|uniref:Uncharacterized protein n=1 Tax=Araneus ventricosus TaxID=182803 RepID=A0A4Y2B5J6_ARAVE|nr:hypothetical protein AVEN_95988-1 [Araneus ventricosus]